MNKKLRKIIAVVATVAVMSTFAIGCGEKKVEQGTGTTKEEYKYASNDYLTDIKWLEDNMSKDNVVVLDARKPDDYKKGHIKGAINAPWQGFANMTGKSGDKNWGTLLPSDKLAEKFGKLGINKDKTVVVYGNKDAWGEDGRLVWMFKMAGINAKMLNGGFDLWSDQKKEVVTDIPTPKETKMELTSLKDDSLNISTDQVKSKLDKAKIVDARAEDEFKGATKFGEARGGHLPKAISLPFNKVYNTDGTIRDNKELEQIFKDAGLNKEDEIITYCTKGIRSAHLALIMKMVGYNNVKNYDASFYDWAGDASNPLEK